MSEGPLLTSHDDHADQGWKVMVAEWLPLFISTITVLTRFFVRACVEDEHFLKRIKLRRLRSEDHLMALSLASPHDPHIGTP